MHSVAQGVEWSSSNQKIGGSIPVFPILHAQVFIEEVLHIDALCVNGKNYTVLELMSLNSLNFLQNDIWTVILEAKG